MSLKASVRQSLPKKTADRGLAITFIGSLNLAQGIFAQITGFKCLQINDLYLEFKPLDVKRGWLYSTIVS